MEAAIGRPLQIYLNRHTVERYMERIKPAMSYSQAEEELYRLLENATVQKEPPTWLNQPPSQNEHEKKRRERAWYVVLEGDDIVLPAFYGSDGRLLTASCIPRGSISEKARKTRNTKRRKKRERVGAGLRRWQGR